MTLQYGLTSAPVAQPHNALVRQACCLLIAIRISHINPLDTWLRQALRTALVIAFMARCGITHPPAGARALLFSGTPHTWPQDRIMLMATSVAVVCARSTTYTPNSSTQHTGLTGMFRAALLQ